MHLLTTLLTLFLTVITTMTDAVPTSFTSILIPLYIYPTPGAWDPLYQAIAAFPAQPFTIIVNPDSGPGAGRFPDANYVAGITRLKKFHNVRLIGYVHVSYTARKLSDVYQDVDRYAEWAAYGPGDISLDGIFVDEAPEVVGNDGVNLRYMQKVRNRILSKFHGIHKAGFTMTNPGVITDKQFYAFTDSLVSYEDTLANYCAPGTLQTSKDLTKSPGTPPGMQGIIVTSFNRSEERELSMLDRVVERGIGFVYFTTDPDYQKFGADLLLLVEEVAKENGLITRRRPLA
ncbi:hypothetical protein TWF281_009842 [Arthrobotrys megalospora]